MKLREFAFESIQGEPLAGFLIYAAKEHSFDFHPAEELHSRHDLNDGYATLMLGTLQFMVGIREPLLLFPFGYCPQESWREDRLSPVETSRGRVKVDVAPPLSLGEAVHLPDADWGLWTFDPASGWLARANTHLDASIHVEVADGVVLGLTRSALVSVRLQPTIT